MAYRLRGFATNIGGYQPLGKACPLDLATPMATYCRAHPRDPCCLDSCGMVQRFNSGVGELNFVQLLERHLSLAIPGLEPRFLIDTGRNGAELSGAACVASCNLRTASFGPLPTANTDHGSVDAYLWLLPPGLSDGAAAVLTETPLAPRRRRVRRRKQGAISTAQGQPLSSILARDRGQLCCKASRLGSCHVG